MKRTMPLLCKNCKLFDERNSVCTVIIVREGQKFELPTKAGDECVWEKNGIEINETRMWSDGKNGFIQTDDPNMDIALCE
jgi:hypothetical protein